MSGFELSEADRASAAAHLAAASQSAAQILDVPAATKQRRIEHVAVIGAGTMGGGIAMALANAAIKVTLIDADVQSLERGLARVRDSYAASVKRGRLDPAAVPQRLERIQGSLRLAEAADADLFIEAVFEDLALKQSIFRELDAVAKPGAILATNTSGLDIDAIAAVTKRPQDVIGAHFFSPAHVMRLLEVVRGRMSAPDVVATLMGLAPRIGKTAVLARVYPGFIGNALFRQTHREAHFLVEDGALPHEVDAALTQFGYAMGVFAVQDLAGTDVGYATRKAQVATRATDRRWSDLILKLVEMGRTGQKSGRGWYRYDAGSRVPQRDPQVEAFIVAESARLGIARAPVDAQQVLERCLFAMVNEGAKLLEQGIAQRASDIDVVFTRGYGFPAAQGGPMFMADRIGLGHVAARVRHWHERLGVWWEPAPLLLQLAAQGRGFASLEPARG
jgi:3-hydroxyacyl-CoA dehydrogenase